MTEQDKRIIEIVKRALETRNIPAMLELAKIFDNRARMETLADQLLTSLTPPQQ